jgi:peptidoglycan/xylan/chitin deacetylase (PgdA/CDA1 family)
MHVNPTADWKRSFKATAARLFGLAGGYAVTRLATAGTAKILMYHRFCDEPHGRSCSRLSLRRRLEHYARHHTVLTMQQFTAALADNAVPKNALVLTVDDGYRDFCTIAAEELLRVGVAVTSFVTTEFIDGTCWIWTEKLAWVCKQLPVGTATIRIDGVTATYRLPEHRGALRFALNNEPSMVPLVEKLRRLDEFATLHGVAIPDRPPDEDRPSTWDDLRRLQSRGIEIGGHTVNHPILSAECEAVLAEEIRGCKQRLDEELTDPAVSFCYPNGTPLDFDERVKRCVKAACFRSAVASQHVRLSFDDLYDIPRYAVGDDLQHAIRVTSGFERLERYCRRVLGMAQDNAQ